MNKEMLPAAFTARIKEMLGNETDAFLGTYTAPRTQGLRLNRLKTGTESERNAAEKAMSLFGLQPIPWCSEGYYYEDPARPGRHPYHEAGLYYIQEPSAMSAAVLLDPRPGETVLDLAAAPGGKTTHIASLMEGHGLLVSNEIHPERAKILAENVERSGIMNALVTSAHPGELARRFPEAFDRIMLDAPCSGEGMFRKDPGAVGEWSPEHVELCASRQWDIVQDAYTMLKPGGRLVYSTCTFNTKENEELVSRLTANYPDMELLATKRLWPHLEKGEGHFVALLAKGGALDLDKPSAVISAQGSVKRRGRAGKGRTAGQPEASAQAAFRQFLEWAAVETPRFRPDGIPILFGDSLYLLPSSFGASCSTELLQGLRIPRAGLHLAHLKKNRLEPAHALAMALRPEQAARVFDLDPDSPETRSWLRGESLAVPDNLQGWTLVTVDRLPLGWGKASAGQLKNHYPKGLRLP
ncbi:RsmB/NOP family class I SAM-dependent RNA methyltransferase [Paenibacillus sp. URB8-2]|uniref:RsmB/NOP family class I SAM-dependent RNA methyltransferase n=1 Tax=Paenibacillus sp. URB8-2 TaxID=2741301 RepID=UPI0015B81BC1|nr:RsmB/NOP family class I SAM-dependent RNA methyltransferase [Paenibacillus sp. URB8-2]BCG58731.1 ribosomal RNA small subunit methyltransferase F [Paenibacillus sp. URB8-2]